MLIIKRKEMESILIGDDIEIIVSEISSDKVKLCVNAPDNIRITRKELTETYDFNKVASENTNKKIVNSLKQKLRK